MSRLGRWSKVLPVVTACLLLGLLGAAGCTPSLIPNTEVQDTEQNREIMALVERYRKAMEQRDVEALRALASSRYFENASSTADPTDDWGFPNLEAVLGELKDSVKTSIYDVHVKAITVTGERAEVSYEYTWNFQYSDGQQDLWTRKTDVNRLDLIREGGQWKILAGM